MERALLTVAATPLLANLLAYAALIGARLSLGRWPARLGADDPKGVSGISWLCAGAFLLLLASLPALPIAGGLAMALWARGFTTRAVRGAALAACLWLAGFAFARWDPAAAWVWLFD